VVLDLPDVGVQAAGGLRDIWAEKSVKGVKTKYQAWVEAHGVLLVELRNVVPAGVYPGDLFAEADGDVITFSDVYAVTSSSGFTVNVTLAEPAAAAGNISITTSASTSPVSVSVTAGALSILATVSLTAGSNNTITILHSPAILSIEITPPEPTYFTGTSDFTLTGSATPFTCPETFCLPSGSKLTQLTATNTAQTIITLPSPPLGPKYLEIDYINNDVAFDSAWEWGSNSRNLTIRVNDQEPVRLEVPLSGRHSELLGENLGWWDSGRLGVLTGGWRQGENVVVVGNEVEDDGFGVFTTWGPDFVGFALYV
ncbi:hypothetical protein BJY04DRAFT_224599, partial [Aspergillus karnatakaensis]|uniref:uncharacterized protein n=1 Tax=Aspergillus karnatakaensis TaxID=1810916 RepID=UPI003CCE4771